MVDLCLDWGEQIHLCLSHESHEECSRLLHDVDDANYVLGASERLNCVAIHTGKRGCRHRKLVIKISGVDMHTWEIPDDYTRFWWGVSWGVIPYQKTVRFELRNSRTDEVLYGRTAWINLGYKEGGDEEGEGMEVDYDRINGETREIVGDSTSEIVTNILGVSKLIAGVNAGIDDAMHDIIEHDAYSVGSVKEKINESISTVIGRINSAGSLFDEGLREVSHKIDSLESSTLESIKQIFIDAASDIADEIMERILSEIERRYEK